MAFSWGGRTSLAEFVDGSSFLSQTFGEQSGVAYKRHSRLWNDLFSKATLCERINALWYFGIVR